MAQGTQWRPSLLPPLKPGGMLPPILHQGPLGRLWYRQDLEFLLPKTCVTMELRSPLAYLDPHSVNLTALLAAVVMDSLKEELYSARLAGLSYTLMATKAGLTLSVRGFHHRLGVLVEALVQQLARPEVEAARLEAMRERRGRSLRNQSRAEPRVLGRLDMAAVTGEKVWREQEMEEVLERATLQELNNFHGRLLSPGRRCGGSRRWRRCWRGQHYKSLTTSMVDCWPGCTSRAWWWGTVRPSGPWTSR